MFARTSCPPWMRGTMWSSVSGSPGFAGSPQIQQLVSSTRTCLLARSCAHPVAERSARDSGRPRSACRRRGKVGDAHSRRCRLRVTLGHQHAIPPRAAVGPRLDRLLTGARSESPLRMTRSVRMRESLKTSIARLSDEVLKDARRAALSWTAMLRLLACLVAAAALTGTLAHAASGTSAACRPTPSDGAGPFQQGGVSAPRRAKIGTGHVLQGRVLQTDCKPVAGALVVLWQAGANGYGPGGAAASARIAREDSALKDLCRCLKGMAYRTSTSPSSTRPTKSW